jgi:GT2 family glycosyltransferase
LGFELNRPVWEFARLARAFVSRRKRLAALAQAGLRRFPHTHDIVMGLARGDSTERYRSWVARYDKIDESDVVAASRGRWRVGTPALLSLIVRPGQTSVPALEEVVARLRGQVYERWEAAFVIEPPMSFNAHAYLADIASRDERFAIHVCADVSVVNALNDALREANGDHAVFLDPDVLPRPHALLLVACALAQNPGAELVYGDEDRIDHTGARSDHYFKPDWSEALLCCRNYLGGLVAFSRARALEVGGFDEELDDEYVWGLALRVGASASTVEHVPFVLTHRSEAGVPAELVNGHETRERAAHALETRLARVGKRARAEPVGDVSFRLHYELPQPTPRVTVVVPSACKLENLKPCLAGLLGRTDYPDVEILLVVNEIRRRVAEQRVYLDAVAREPNLRSLVYGDRPFNLAWASNWAVRQAQGELLCFLNDDTDVIERGWLSAMVARVLQDRVAAVGALLVYPNDRIQHAGVILGVGGIAGHADVGTPRQSNGYHERLLVDQDVACVTGACMLVRRDVFEALGGFDESFAGAFNDVDFCLRVRRAGWRIVWTPNARLCHRESVSIGHHYSRHREVEWTAEATLMTARWREELRRDPFYSPNLSLDPLQLWEPAFPPRVSYSWRR